MDEDIGVPMGISESIAGNRGAIAFAMLVMLTGSAAYFAFGSGGEGMGASKADSGIFGGIQLKVSYAADGSIDILAKARNNALSRLKASEGEPIPEEGTVVFGSAEAAKLRSGGAALASGGRLADFSGLDTEVGGVLERQGDAVDSIAFLSPSGFDRAQGEMGKAYAKVGPDGSPKLFYVLGMNETAPEGFRLAEGSREGYQLHNLDGNVYYPLILGSEEAKAMRRERLFSRTGDAVRGLFGKDFVVAGILEETNTSLDRLQFVPLGESALGS